MFFPEENMKSITLVTKGRNTCEALENQLIELIGDRVNIKSYYIDGRIRNNIADDLIVVSSQIIYHEAKKYMNPASPVIIARRSLNYNEIDKLLDIPSGADVLLVNDLISTSEETVSLLKAMGIDHINYHPYSPEIKEYPKLELAVTPGELELVPDCVKRVIDIKTRNIDVTTLVEILKALDLLDEKANLLSAKYIKDIINMIKKIKRMADANKRISNQLQTIINTVHDGIIALDEKGNLSVFNPVAEEIFGATGSEILGKNIRDDFPKKDMLLIFNKQIGEEQFIKIRDKHIVVNSSLIKEDDKVIGALYTLKDVTEIQRLEEELRRKLRSQENYARYTFDDIAGTSEAIKSTIGLAKKIAVSHSPILIQGESGTGKELFAQAIHNASPRKRGPFVPVNFAALPESLLESELFGYEEGAFTGARKGGMPGLFEQAHGGTIFLDEIGDAPLSFQVRLLRVLQEKQVRRIGSSRMIPIDIRVIAATNKDIKQLIEKGDFRQDLYYRLNVLPLHIPPLRERKQDILPLAKTFYTEFFKREPLINAEDYFKEVKEALLAYDWPGNIRELHNIVEYLINISFDIIPKNDLLPEELIRVIKEKGEKNDKEKILVKILMEIARANAANIPIGRRSLSKITGLTEGTIRKVIEEMKKKGLIRANKGIKGLELLHEGYEIIKAFNF
jgi:PAS domain S-box-containing protein